MDTQTRIHYEIIEPLSNERIVSFSREEALAYYEQGWIVYEHSVTITFPSPFVSTETDIVLLWNNNPHFEE
ncbi:MAG: hypothetical protein ACRC46_14000 [Thermoguttaceae bacterium]